MSEKILCTRHDLLGNIIPTKIEGIVKIKMDYSYKTDTPEPSKKQLYFLDNLVEECNISNMCLDINQYELHLDMWHTSFVINCLLYVLKNVIVGVNEKCTIYLSEFVKEIEKIPEIKPEYVDCRYIKEEIKENEILVHAQYYEGKFDGYKTYTNFTKFYAYNCEETPENKEFFTMLVTKALNKIQEYDQKIRERIANDLMPPWCDEDADEPMSKETFCERLNLDIVEFYFETPDDEPEPFAEFWYDDDDMFGGHAICVEVDENFEPISETSLQG